MTKNELLKMISLRLVDIKENIDGYGNRDELIENVASNGNHNDTFEIGETFGWYLGQATALKSIQKVLEETPEVEQTTN